MAPEDAELLQRLGEYAERPYDFVYTFFPWGQPGTALARREGLERWQAQVLWDLQAAYENGRAERLDMQSALEFAWQVAIKSGHDVGKSALLALIIWWAISTRIGTKARATANTEKQLRTVLWGEIKKWQRLFLAGHLFKWTATQVKSIDPDWPEWGIDAITWSEDNPEAFQGLHNEGGRVLVVMDEASAIADKVWEVVDGVMHEKDTELLWFCPGNPTRNKGRFRDCWGKFAEAWRTYSVDSREVSFANQEKITQTIRLYGADTNFVKVRYLGEFPDAANEQLIKLTAIQDARRRPAVAYQWEPLILGVDVARFGDNESVIAFRRGKDAKSIPMQRYRGLDNIELADKVAAAIGQHSPDAVFIDENGVGSGVVDYLKHLGHQVIGVMFGGRPGSFPHGVRVGNKRAEMYHLLRDALYEGLAIEDSQDLEDQLIAVEYYFKKLTLDVMLVPKEEMDESPDLADALALTYAFPAAKRAWRREEMAVDYDPLSPDHMRAA